jgi:HAD superfamily hydrolase (TIGR01509 family)
MRSSPSGKSRHQFRRLSLVIFDCDGVLVDSEMLSAEVLMAMMAEAGLPITPEIFRSDFLGRSYASAAGRVLQRFGRPLPDDFQAGYRERLFARMRSDLLPMDGVFDVLRTLSMPFCLATSSSPERLAITLVVTGLEQYFVGRRFTASEVAHGKPAPDLFLHAAARMGVPPAECLVLEDSEMGVLAARAAGMMVWHFTGGAHFRDGYKLPRGVLPDRVICGMAELQRALAQSDTV